MKHIRIKDLVCASFFCVILLYGSWGVLTEVVYTILPFGIILALILFGAGYLLRVPIPSPEAVEAVLGKDPYSASNEDGYMMKTVAHRGAGLDAPENTLAAFKMCAEKGCDVIEFDITLTKDNVPIIFHDANLERLTDLKMNVAEKTYEELINVDLSVKHVYKDRFAKTNIPTLEQTVTQLLESGQRMIIDIKDNDRKMVKVVHDLFSRHQDLYSRAMVSSFYAHLIYLIRKGDPKIVCSLAWRPYAFAYDSCCCPIGKGNRRYKEWYIHYCLELFDIIHEWALPRITYYLLGISAILLHKDAVSPFSLLKWKEKGVRVFVWTVNTPAEKQYFAKALKVTYLTDTLTAEGTTHSSL